MRVALVAGELGIGGLPNHVLAVARLLAEAGHEVLVAHGNAPLPAHLEVAGLALRHLRGFDATGTEAEATAAVRALRDWGADVVHVHFCGNTLTLRQLVDSGLPLVRTFHDLTSVCLRRGRRRWYGDRCQRPLSWSCAAWGCLLSPPAPGSRLPRLTNLPGKLAERDLYRQFGATIACSRFMARTLAVNGFDAARLHVVPNFTGFEADATAARPPSKLPGQPGRDRPFELLFSGQAVTGKGLEPLVEALQGIGADWRLTVLSDGPRLPAVRAMAEASGLTPRIRFEGWVTQAETRMHYMEADLLVIPSIIDEALPLVGIEAMSFGTPLVGFAVGGLPDYLLDGTTGVLIEDVSPAGLREGLKRAMADPVRVAEWGRTARSMVARCYTRAVHLAALQSVYAKAGGRAEPRQTIEDRAGAFQA